MQKYEDPHSITYPEGFNERTIEDRWPNPPSTFTFVSATLFGLEHTFNQFKVHFAIKSGETKDRNRIFKFQGSHY